MSDPFPSVLELVAQIVSAYCASNTVTSDVLPALIHQVHEALTRQDDPRLPPADEPVPAVDPRKSVFPNYIVCLEDGKKMKMLKRHLGTSYGMSLDQYREKWDLPPNYPMVAPNYSKRRSTLAKRLGLGRRPAVDVIQG